MPDAETVTAYDGTQVRVEPIRPLPDGGARIELDAVDGPRWRVDVTDAGETTVVTSWDETGTLADVALPDWAGDILERLRQGNR